jgi:predicted dehydrogenase
LEELLSEPSLQLISFCSPFKDEQGDQIIQALEAGKHVYAEKPCCLSEAVLDRIIASARRTGMRFHEMNVSSLAQPYCTLRDIVQAGAIGEVIQVISQKSYPWVVWRPKDERVDGGLTRQVGLYNVRFAEHVAGLQVKSLDIKETELGNDHANSDCRRAVSMLMTFENGAVGSAVANYCCPEPPDWNQWGYEMLRIFGTKGFVEAIDNGRIGTLAITGQPPQELDFSAPGQDMLELFLEEIETDEDRVPFTLEEELSPTRWVLRAKT